LNNVRPRSKRFPRFDPFVVGDGAASALGATSKPQTTKLKIVSQSPKRRDAIIERDWIDLVDVWPARLDLSTIAEEWTGTRAGALLAGRAAAAAGSAEEALNGSGYGRGRA